MPATAEQRFLAAELSLLLAASGSCIASVMVVESQFEEVGNSTVDEVPGTRW